MKILILKPSSLGDVVQALPVLRLLKRHLPASRIYWWIESAFAPLLEGDPDLAGVVPFQRRGWLLPRRWAGLWRSIRWMRAQAFDYVLDLQSLARSGTIAWLANGSLTIGLDEPREGARGFYDRIVPRPSFHTHAVDWYLRVLPLLGVPIATTNSSALCIPANGRDGLWRSAEKPQEIFSWLPERPEIAGSIRQKWPVAAAPWVLLQPGARWPNKRWPAESFAELVSKLGAHKPDWRFAILGTTADRPLAELISCVNPQRCLDLTGRTSLPEMVEWIRASALMVTNDTGPMHVAAALRKPVIALFGPTAPQRTGPYGQLDQVLQLPLPCVPCLRSRCWHSIPMECLRALSPMAVLDKSQQLLG